MRLSEKSKCLKKVLDVRMRKLLAWVWKNFPTNRLEIKFFPGEYNKGDDGLSQWGVRSFGVM